MFDLKEAEARVASLEKRMDKLEAEALRKYVPIRSQAHAPKRTRKKRAPR